MSIAFLDVYYGASGARAACAVAADWQSAVPVSTHFVDIESVEEYEPGQFYRRELPCLLAVLNALPDRPSVVVVDGYVWLPDGSRKGLGAHLYETLGSKIPVVGVAKTAFVGAESSPIVLPVQRGESKKPLFITAAGVELATAGVWVREMAGPHRIPTMITIADQLSRSGAIQRDG